VTDVAAARYAGSRTPRVEDARLLTGEGTFVDDVSLPGMLHACFVRSPLAHGRILGIDASAALAAPGVHAVLLAADLNPGVHEQWHTAVGKEAPETPRPPLADDVVRHVGDPVALVIAEDRYLAEDAAELVEVDYEPLPAVTDPRQSREAEVQIHPDRPGNVVGAVPGPPTSSVEPAFAEAAHVVEVAFHQHAYAAVPMETRGMVVSRERSSGELTIWTGSQVPHEIRIFCARLLGIGEHLVRVIARDTGGGFGQKAFVQREEMCLMLAATKVAAPVKWIEDRRENLLAAGKSRREQATAAFAFDEDGTILAGRIDHLQDAGAYPTPAPVGSGAMVSMMFPGPYKVPALSFLTTCVYTNTAGRSPYRGPWQFESVVREVLLDIAARRMGMDPVELRRRNLLSQHELPYRNVTGFNFDHSSPLETFEEALRIIDYEGFRREQVAARAEGRYLGIGTGTYIEPTTAGFGVYASEAATIRIEPSGVVNVYLAGGSAGNSIESSAVQLAADALGADIADVRTIQGDTAVTPFGGGTCGSRSGSMVAGAVGETAAILRERLKEMAAHRLEAAVDDIELAGSRATVRGTPAVGVSFAELAHAAYAAPHTMPPGVPAGLEASARYTTRPSSTWANATHACTCEVDVVTGQVKLLRYVVAEDCGPMINPNVVEGQIAGGTVQGIGGVLLEHLAYDKDGNPLATTFADYLLPTATDVPTIEYGHVVTDGPGPGGYKGVGEGGAIGAPPAVMNAVADALAPFGVDVTEQPLTPERILDLIGEHA
jgi:aerobic carbon-monoxide dehydrogenase large subunit